MINLSALTTAELVQLDKALTAIDTALEMLLDNGAIDEEEGVDLPELSEALVEELDRRTMEDAQYHVARAVKRGELVEVVRPDGQIGYAPGAY